MIQMSNNIHNNYILVDGHNDTMMKVIDEETWLPIIDIGKSTDNHIDIPKLIEGGVHVAFFASFTSGYYGNEAKSLSRNLALINALYFTAENNQDTFQIATTVDEIKEAVQDHKIAAVPTIEGAYAIDEKNYVELLKQFYDLGIRVIAPTWNYSNAIGEGCGKIYGDEDQTPSHGGLTELGKKVVEEMNGLGQVVDVSHLAEETFWDIIKITNSPLIASHSGVYHLKNHQRNLKDSQLQAIKENGGVVGVVLFPKFLSDKEEVYVKDVVDHMDYIVDLIGIDHVGIGSDFDGAAMPLDLEDSSKMYKITDELIHRGYSEADIKKIVGENMLRVLEECQERARYHPSILAWDIQYTDQKFILNVKDMDFDRIKSKIIIDGIVHQPTMDTETSTIFYEIQEPLKEKFHVVTFEIHNGEDIQRYTNIVY